MISLDSIYFYSVDLDSKKVSSIKSISANKGIDTTLSFQACDDLTNIINGLNNGLIAYYPFTGNANDSSGNGNHGTVNGAVLTTDRFGNSNCAYSFNGLNTYLIGDATNFPTSTRTVSLWFYANDIGSGVIGGRSLFGYGGQTCGQSWIQLMNITQSPNSYEVQTHCTVQSVTSNYGSAHPNSKWNNWIITTETNGTKFFIDGVLIKSDPTFFNGTIVNGKKFVIGSCVSQDGLNFFTGDYNTTPFNGKLDEIRIYNRLLAQQEITYIATH